MRNLSPLALFLCGVLSISSGNVLLGGNTTSFLVAPVAVDDVYTTDEDQTLNVPAPGVLANDSDAENDPMQAILVSGPTSGNLTLNADGSFSYTPVSNFFGAVTFSYMANAGGEDSNTVTVTITVDGLNDAPVAVADGYATDEDVSLTVSAPGVLSNDSDVEGAALTAVLGAGVSNGSLTLNANGSFTYTPNANFFGSDSFTYQASDGNTTSALVTVTINVNSVNDAPVAVADGYATDEDVSLTVAAPGVLGNDSDVEGTALTAVLGTNVSNGSLTLNANGSFTYTPNANFFGSDSFTYQASDGNTTSALVTVTINVNSVNDAPVAVADGYATDEDVSLTVAAPGVLGNDSDVEGTALTAVLGAGVSNGSLTLNSNGSFTYTPNANFFGSDSFTYRASDGNTTSALVTVTINVNSVNDAPVAVADGYSTNEDNVLSVSAPGVLGNDSDVEGTALTVVLGTNVSNGSLTLNANGSFTYTPNANFFGSDAFTYRASDGNATSDPVTVTITIDPVNDAPVAVADGYATDEDTPLTITAPGVLGNDSDVDGNSITADLVTPPSNGTLSLSPDGSFTYTPNANINGSDAFVYRVYDGTVYSPSVAASITINAINDAPVAVNDAVVTLEDNPVAINVLSNDTDIDDALSPSSVTITVPPANGSTSINTTTGAITYTPNTNYNSSDSFEYTVNDVSGATSNEATVSISITAVNDAPVAVADDYETNEDTPVVINVLANDSDVDNAINPSSVVVTSGPSNGSVSVNTTTGAITYTPANNYFGSDSFEYTVNDVSGATSNEASVSINIEAVNDIPQITNQVALDTDEDTPLVLSTADFTIVDPDNSSFTLIMEAGDNYTVNGSEVIPAQDYFGPLIVNVRVSDGSAQSDIFEADVDVSAVNDIPQITDQASLSFDEDTQFTLLVSHFTIEDPDNSSFTLTVLPGAGYSVNSNTITPPANFFGTLQVGVRVNDGSANSQDFNAQVIVTPVNDLPSFDPITSPITINEDGPSQIVTINNITEGPGENQTITITASSDNTALIPNPVVSYDGVSSSATLTFQSVANRFGTAVITVTAEDEELGEFTRQFTVNVQGINDPPTLNNINDVDFPEDAPLQSISFNGISAGPFETQDLTATVSTDSPELFDVLQVVYTSPNGSGSINVDSKPNVSGSASVTVTVRDNGSNSPPNSNVVSRTFTINITPVNDPPVITGHSVISILEEQSITLQLSHITFSDPDNTSGFTLSVSPGANYSVSGNTVTPDTDFNGVLEVPVTVSDGSISSEAFDVLITVTGVNDIPQIIGQNQIFTGEAEPVTLTLNDLIVFDPDDTYPDDFTLFVLGGAQYSVNGNTVTPVANFSGTLKVKVFVSDGSSNSIVYEELEIQVNSVNDPPTITGVTSPLSVTEDQSITLEVTHLTITDPDNTYPGDFSLLVLPGSNYTFSGRTVTPSLNYTGPLSVAVSVSDGQSTSSPFNVPITINAVNDAPVITGQKTLTTDEDVSITLQLSDLIVTDPDNSYPGGFTLTILEGSNYSVSNHTVTPAPNFNGDLTVQVLVNDGMVNSNTFELDVAVTPINDAPVVTAQNPQPLDINEDEPVTIVFNNLSVTDVDNTYPQGFSIAVQAGENYTFSGATVTPAQNYTGPLTVGVIVNDGSRNSAIFDFDVNVLPANDPPVITGHSELKVNEDQSITLELEDIQVEDPDNTYPAGFTLTLLPGTNYTVSGTTITPSPDFFGNLSVGARVNDGANNSAVYNLVVQVLPVNDAPSFDPIADITLAENADLYTVTITNISSGPLESQQLLLTATSGNTVLIPDPSESYNGTASSATISFKPATNRTGEAVITVKVVDTGLLEFTRTFTVSVINTNDPPTLNPIVASPIQEDSDVQSILLTGITAGPQESQTLLVEASSTNPEFFETFEVAYQSPQSTATLKVKPKTNLNGAVDITVTVTDDGDSDPPNVNFIQQTFTLVIEPVNDAPEFTSNPVLLAVAEEQYTYLITAADVDEDALTIEATEKPAWMTFTDQGNGQASLTGVPPVGVTGTFTVRLAVQDDAGASDLQEFAVSVDTRPVVDDFTLSTNEDETLVIAADNFSGSFTDADGQTLQKIMVVRLPSKGIVRVGDQPVTLDSEIDISALDNFQYVPNQDVNGRDTVEWKGSDGVTFSANAGRIIIDILPVNDAPVISVLETTAIEIRRGEGPGIISEEFTVTDVDNDSLVSAEIGFRRENFVANEDMLLFENTSLITGTYDPLSGIMTLTGKAPIAAYIEAIRSIRYDNISEVFTDEDVVKTISYTVGDGKALSVTRDREIRLIDTFVDLEIPNAFTPNNDMENDTWEITNISGHTSVHVRVFNTLGTMVYESEGEYVEWDGTYKDQLLPVGSYFYTIDLNLEFRKRMYKGTVTILY